jgi:hypothetical protein
LSDLTALSTACSAAPAWPAATGTAAPPGEHRRAPRTNMFIAAIAEVDGRAIAARVRNMSQTGAMLELVDPVRQGAGLVLRRGEHVAAGMVVWSQGIKCGIAFADLVSVSAWMGRSPGVGEGQRRVDAIQAQIRGGAVPMAAPESVRPAPSAQALQQRLSEELVELKRMIDMLGEDLAAEPVMLDRHAGSMQQFDIMSQTLGHLARVLIAPDPVEAVGGIGMDALRKRLAG